MNTKDDQIFALKRDNNHCLVFWSLNELGKHGMSVNQDDVGPGKLFRLNDDIAIIDSLKTGKMTFVTRKHLRDILGRQAPDEAKRTLTMYRDSFTPGHWMRFAAKPNKAKRPDVLPCVALTGLPLQPR